MSETRQNVTIVMLLTILVMNLMLGWLVNEVYNHQRTDNQVISTLHSENARLQRDFTDTSVALDSIALKNNALEEENSRLKAELEMAKGRSRL